MPKKRWLFLLPVAAYLLYLLVGAAMMLTGRAYEWTVFPDYVVTTASKGVDDSGPGTDGPYIFYRDSAVIVRSVYLDSDKPRVKSDTFSLSARGDIAVNCSFPDHPEWNFTTSLKDSLSVPPAVYPPAGNMLAISDIEGNFGAFRALLLSGGVIDSAYRWRFGDGHLVLVGDFFDRGLHVTECLWLIYHLESEAARAGGRVHFILGNHDLMNMQGDLRYLRYKYSGNAHLMEADYKSFYGKDSELGRWLGTKNVMEQIGGILFVHAGISPEVAALQLPPARINELCRPWYHTDKATIRSTAPPVVRTLFDGKTSPFWYRGLVKEDASEAHVNSFLRQYSAGTIVVGHTVMDHISRLYAGRVVAIDVAHAAGTVEALRIQGGRFFRMDASGKSVPL